jgi:hypothetical protein
VSCKEDGEKTPVEDLRWRRRLLLCGSWLSRSRRLLLLTEVAEIADEGLGCCDEKELTPDRNMIKSQVPYMEDLKERVP